MAGSERRWVKVKVLTAQERAVVAAECERFIAETLKPRFLPEVRQTPFNYPIDIFGKWRGSEYSFIIRYRSGFPENAGEEFNAPFTRLDHLEECWAEARSMSCGAGIPDNGGDRRPRSRLKRPCA